MKKNFRGGTGQGPKKTKSKEKFEDRTKHQNPGEKGKKTSQRDIKNARSLSDVIGGVGKRPSAPAPADSARRDRQAGRPKDPQSKKLKYITNFQPPSATSAPAAADVRPEPTVDTPRRFSSSAAPAQQPGPEHELSETHPHFKRRDRFQSKTKKAPGKPESPRQRKPEATPKPVPLAAPRGKTFAKGRKGGAKVGERVQGVIKRHPDGYGFLIPDDSSTPDVYISRHSMTGVMTNDRVEAQVYEHKGGRGEESRLSGDIVQVISRSNKRVVGRYLPVDLKYGMIQDDGRGWGADLRIAAKDSMGAKERDLVAVEILQYPGPSREFTGRVVDLIGDINDPLNDVIRVVHQQGIPMEFSAQALEEARRFGGRVTEAEMKDRKNLRHLPLITIDGATARDFDDAIWVDQTDRGFHLIVGIADVSHYVKPGTKLDQEAYERGTSTYFPNFVVPMLPEELSNELCSLKPHVPRLCFACEMHIDFQGEIQDFHFFEAVMESKARVTYGEAQEVIDGRIPHKLQPVKENILRAADLAKILMTKRFREGSLDLEIPETQVVVDASGESVDIIKSERLFAHRLIEELMLVTNICTARFFERAGVAGIYRIHEEPDPDNIRALQRYLWNLGGSRSVMGDQLAKKLTKALQAVQGKPEAQILNILTLRTMQQAQYSAENIGHFGLGFSHYSHFTSPIRRYPDLIAHRVIKSQLYPRYRSQQMNEDELMSSATFLSACEQRSVKAERQVISIKKARFMQRFVGEELDGIISSVARFGVFVLLRQFDVDGMIKLENLGNDRFFFDEENLRLIGQRSGARYVIGDAVKIRVVKADVEAGKIDFELAELPLASEDDDENLEDEFETDSAGVRESSRATFKGRKKHQQKHQQKHSATDRKKERVDSKERGKASNDRRGVRKERVSKRRGKN